LDFDVFPVIATDLTKTVKIENVVFCDILKWGIVAVVTFLVAGFGEVQW